MLEIVETETASVEAAMGAVMAAAMEADEEEVPDDSAATRTGIGDRLEEVTDAETRPADEPRTDLLLKIFLRKHPGRSVEND